MTMPQHFCPSEFPPRPKEECLFHFFPIPLEKSVSYGGGAAAGPAAILEAADELEPIYLGDAPGEAGMFVHTPIDCGEGVSARQSLDALASGVKAAVEAGHVPMTLGGEHTVTLGAVEGLQAAGREFGIVQFDAHADLRDTYEGSPLSHACVIRRSHELGVPVFQLGIRGISAEEVQYRKEHADIGFIDAHDLYAGNLPDPLLPADFPQEIYITFDVDGLDASLMPATGTPVPGGLFWHHFTDLMARIRATGRRIIGMDFVELAPMEGNHAPDFTTACVVYAAMRDVLLSHGKL